MKHALTSWNKSVNYFDRNMNLYKHSNKKRKIIEKKKKNNNFLYSSQGVKKNKHFGNVNTCL